MTIPIDIIKDIIIKDIENEEERRLEAYNEVKKMKNKYILYQI